MDKKIDMIVKKLISYDNKDKLSWLEVLKELLRDNDMEYNDVVLNLIIKEITRRGYDIVISPFGLEKYK